jgi:cytochrome d ubiquinol oxidase subunit I
MSGVLVSFVHAQPPQMLPAREQMAFTLMFHIVLVPLGVALPFLTLVMHYIGLRRKDAVALQLARRWSTVMAIQFAVGVVTGTILSFEFGLLWPGLMARWGDVFGLGFGIEAWAFFLEAILLAIYLYGWKRLSPRTHFLLGLPLPVVGLVGAFGILAANAWMNTPRGFTLDAAGQVTSVDVGKALFTPMFGPEYCHFVAAAFMTAAFVVSGVYALGWLRGRRDRYHWLGFTVPFTVAAVITPVQIFVGDWITRAVYEHQPVKFASMELVWNTGSHVPEYLFGRLNPDGTVSGGLRIPGLDSFLAGFSPNTTVQGMTTVGPDARPTVELATITHWSFDVMVGIGTLLLGLAFWYGLAWLRHRDIPRSRWFYRCATVSGVASVVAMEAGWITTEVGRQPWIVYGYMRVSEAVTGIHAGAIWLSFTIIVILYAGIAWGFVGLLLRMRSRWRVQDTGARTVQANPEVEVPYGPRAPSLYGDEPLRTPESSRAREQTPHQREGLP